MSVHSMKILTFLTKYGKKEDMAVTKRTCRPSVHAFKSLPTSFENGGEMENEF